MDCLIFRQDAQPCSEVQMWWNRWNSWNDVINYPLDHIQGLALMESMGSMDQWSSHSMDSMDLSIRDPTDHPQPYIQPWMDNIKITSFKTKERKKKNKRKIMQCTSKMSNSNYAKIQNAKCNRTPVPSKYRQGSNAWNHISTWCRKPENQKHTKMLGIPLSHPITSHHPLTSCGRQDQRPAPSSNPTRHGDS